MFLEHEHLNQNYIIILNFQPEKNRFLVKKKKKSSLSNGLTFYIVELVQSIFHFNFYLSCFDLHNFYFI